MKDEVDIAAGKGSGRSNLLLKPYSALAFFITRHTMFHLLDIIVGVVLDKLIPGHVLKNKADMAVNPV